MGASRAELSSVIETGVCGRDPAEREGGSLRGRERPGEGAGTQGWLRSIDGGIRFRYERGHVVP